MSEHDDSSLAPVSRRNFLARAGQVGGALALAPHLRPFVAPGPDERRGGTAPDGGAAAGIAEVPAALYNGLQWRMLGPFRGGRCASATGVPGRPNEFYFGAVNGGVWKTIDAGRVWFPIFDSQPVASIGAIAVAPSAPDVVYVGSGESTLRDSMGYGNGVYKSTDAGRTWTHLGLDDTHHIGKIAVDPRNPDVVFVAAIGHMYAPNSQRGLFRSHDGGRTWERVLFRNDDVGAVEVVIDSRDSNVVYAGLWNTRRPPWFTYAPTNGPGGGIFKSTDGGRTWKELTVGLPSAGIGRSGIAVAPSDPRRVYAVIDDLVPEGVTGEAAARVTSPGMARPVTPPAPGQGGFFRSDDAGATWTRLSTDPMLWGRGWYFEKLTVDPRDPETVYVSNVVVSRTMDGGHTWVALRGSPGGDDYHQPWVSPDDSNIMIVASDQGTMITHNARAADPRQVTWSSWLNQPTAQLYHLSVDYRFPYWVTGAQQDSGAVAVHSRGKFAEISMRDWEPIGAGGESGYTAGDPLHPGIIFGGNGQRWNLAINAAVPDTTVPKPPTGQTDRADWTQPLVLSKADPHALYYGSQFLYRSSDAARTWTQVSPDLTRADPGIPRTLDVTAAAATDRNGRRGVIYTIAPSPLAAPMLWIGTDDGSIQLTRDGGATWTNVTPRELTAWSRVTMLEASHFDPNTAYASVDRHQLQDFEPYIFRTRDGGKTWQRITTGLPRGVYVHTVKEDPMRRGLLVSGTERGAFVSFDDGDHWQPLQLNLPVTSVRDFEIYSNDLIVATHGRGFWVIDDIAPLRQMDAAVVASDVHLFKPSDTINVIDTGDNGTPLQKDEPQAPQAPNGAIIAYYLKRGTPGPVTLEVLDSTGTVVHTFRSANAPAPPDTSAARGRTRASGIPNVSPLWQPTPSVLPTDAGMHRVVWDPSTPGHRSGDGEFVRGTVLTGTFTARLTAEGTTHTQTFTVRPDPRLPVA